MFNLSNLEIFLLSGVAGLVVDIYRRLRKIEITMKDKPCKKDLTDEIDLHMRPIQVKIKDMETTMEDQREELKEDIKEVKDLCRQIIHKL